MILMPQLSESMIKINDEQANYAKKISARLSQPLYRRKGMIDLLGITCAIECFKLYGFKVNAFKGLHNIAEIFEEFKINDIYVNNYRIDVITQFCDEKIKIPYLHKQYDCFADYYIVVRLGERLKDASILGYFKPSQVNLAKVCGDYIEVDRLCLKPVRALCLELKKPAVQKLPQGKHLDCISLFLRFMDGELQDENKKAFIKHLLACPACTKKLADMLDFDRTVKGVRNVDDLIEKCSAAFEEDEIMASFKKASLIAKNMRVADKEIQSENSPSVFEQKYKSIIDAIFNATPKAETSALYSFAARKRKFIITAVVVIMFLAVSVFIAFRSSNSEISSISDADTEYSQESSYNLEAQNEFTGSNDLPQEVYGASNVPDYSLAGRTTGEPLVATINKISWEVPENIASKANYTRFLQLVGKNVKLNLQNDLLLSNDFAKNSVIKLSIRIASNGDVIGMRIMQSSGSGPIDEIIKKSVSETLSYMKPPSHGLISRPVDVTLVISL